jgi:hypothetical protein
MCAQLFSALISCEVKKSTQDTVNVTVIDLSYSEGKSLEFLLTIRLQRFWSLQKDLSQILMLAHHLYGAVPGTFLSTTLLITAPSLVSHEISRSSGLGFSTYVSVPFGLFWLSPVVLTSFEYPLLCGIKF